MQPSKSDAPVSARGLYGTRALSTRQQRVIELVAQGLKNSEVAEIIGTTRLVVTNYLRVIFDKLGFCNRVELAPWYEARRAELLYQQLDSLQALRRNLRPEFCLRREEDRLAVKSKQNRIDERCT